MEKTIFAAVLLAGLLLVAGCGGGDSGTTPSKTTPYVGGSDALAFNFVADEPPEEALDQDQLPFVVTVSVENKGEWDVPMDKAKISLRGFRAADFSDPETVKNPDEDLEKTYIDTDGNVIPGTLTHVTFDGFSYTGTLTANNMFPILADVCYEYGTEAQIDLCYLNDLTEKNEVCEVRGPKTVYSSAAPISVEDVSEDLGGTDKISFNFDIVHRGAGKVSKLGSDCNADDEHVIKNKVWVEVNSELGGLTCSGLSEGDAMSGYVTLVNGKRNVRCTQDVPGDGDYVKKAYITLKYEYEETKRTEILIKHVTD